MIQSYPLGLEVRPYNANPDSIILTLTLMGGFGYTPQEQEDMINEVNLTLTLST